MNEVQRTKLLNDLETQQKIKEDAIAAERKKKELKDKNNADILAQWEEEKEREKKLKEK